MPLPLVSRSDVCFPRERYENYRINNNNGVYGRFLYGRICYHRNVHCSLLLSKDTVNYGNVPRDVRGRRNSEGDYDRFKGKAEVRKSMRDMDLHPAS